MIKQSKPAIALQIVALATVLHTTALAKRKPASQSPQTEAIIQIISQNAGKEINQLDWSHKGIFPAPYRSPIKNNVDNVIPDSMRSAVLLNGSTLDSTANRVQPNQEVPPVLLLGNVRHKTADGSDKIYVAEIPWTNITEVKIQKQQMSVVDAATPGAAEINSMVAHARIKFIFDVTTPVKLVSEIKTNGSNIEIIRLAEAIEQRTLSLSAEALTDQYNVVDGAQNKFAFGHFFQTESIPTGNGGGELSELSVETNNTELMKNIFLEAVITSQRHDREQGETPTYINTYNVVSNNCITATFKLLERAEYERHTCNLDDVDKVLNALPEMENGAPPPLTPELKALLAQAEIPAEVAQAVVAQLYGLRSPAIGEGSARHYPDVWVATRIPCWLGISQTPTAEP